MIFNVLAPPLCARISTLGRRMARFPVAPRYSKMLTVAYEQDVLKYVIAIVAALSVQELFDTSYMPKEDNDENVCFERFSSYYFYPISLL